MSAPAQLNIFGGEEALEPVDRDRWCTPAPIIEAARATMRGIDLDAASNARAQEVVRAARWYGLDEGRDALLLPWAGRVWCNPPYSRGLIDLFAARIVSEWERGEVERMIVLVNASLNAQWMGRLLDSAEYLMIPPSRIDFWHAETGKTAGGNAYDQIAFAWGVALRCLAPFQALGWRVR